MLITLFAFILLVVSLGALAQLLTGYRLTPTLASQPPLGAERRAPRVSIVVAARDEARAVEAAVQSLLRQDYPDLEVVAVDDRSSDGTGEVLDRLAAAEPRLRVAHVVELPAGWLGKTHALEQGARAATGDLLLFTDADVVLERTALSRAVALMEARGVDHLAVGPGLHIPSAWLALVVNFFMLSFLLFQRPWRAANPRSRDHIGIGAFNLVRRSAYERAGGHARVALRPDDDVKLGKALKQTGARQLFADGRGFATVEWYRTVGEMTEGLRKNSFAGMEYRISAAIGATIATLLLHLAPFVGLVFAHGVARAMFGAVCAILVGAYFTTAWMHRTRPWLALFYPVAALLFLWIFVRNVALTVIEGGITWRGTRYSLEELRKNVV